MGAIDAYLRQFDDAWEHKWESLRSVLEGVGEAEAAWQAPCYRAEEHEEGWPPPGSVQWQVAHLAHCKRYYTKLIRARGQEGRPPVPEREDADGVAGELAALEAVHRAQRAEIEALREEDLDRKVGTGMPLDEFLAMIVRHDIWHASQIAVARRLWREREID